MARADRTAAVLAHRQTVLSALHEADDALVRYRSSRVRVITDLVPIYKALGERWQDVPPEAVPQQTASSARSSAFPPGDGTPGH